MGTKMAPDFANLYMAHFKEQFVFNYPIQPVYYRRYIDDIFKIWNHSQEQLSQFQKHLNEVHPTIKFIFESSRTNLPYLDVSINLENQSCFVKPHFKSTNTFSHVMGNSYHPKSTFKGIYKGENVRILRNCTREEDYLETVTFMKQKFTDRKFN